MNVVNFYHDPGFSYFFSDHAQRRFQQRGINREHIETMLLNGKLRHHKYRKSNKKRDNKNVYIVSMDSRCRRRARSKIGAEGYKRQSEAFNIYLVVVKSTGGVVGCMEYQVITVAHRKTRLKF